MAAGVKRRYESPRRREQAAATRRQILEAAQRLFEEQGYAATPMSAIAAEAGVALKTVYVAFETKSGVLRALWNLLLRGDEADIPIPERDWYRKVLAETDAERAVRLGAHNSRLVKERAGGVLAVIRNAAHSDPDVGALWDRIGTEFYDNQRAVVERLHKLKALKPGLGVTRGADLLWSLNHPDVWELLVRQRGWTPSQYERWLGDTLVDQLLR
jgi:TetR/AcrR family transcriptional regulator, regulator of autoinduction and epiphytic fitness